MSEDKEVTVTVTPEDMEFRARAKAAGVPDVLISVYGTALRRLVADEREACARVAESLGPIDYPITAALYRGNVADAIRARKP